MRLASFFIVTLVACGGSSSSSGTPDGNGSGPYPDAPTDPALRYFPWTVGAKWSYKLTDPTGAKPPATGRLTTIGPEEAIGGRMAYKVHIETLGGSKDAWEIPQGDLDVRYQTMYYDATGALTETDADQAYRLKLDESIAHTMPGAMYSETFSETITKPGTAPSTKSETLVWKVISNTESVTVIAGSYTNVLHVQRFNATKSQTIDYWFARGVGRIKETGNTTDEELESYTP